MLKIVSVFAALIAITFGYTISISNTYTVLLEPNKAPEISSNIPPDDNITNFGDIVYKTDSRGQRLTTVVITNSATNDDQFYELELQLANKTQTFAQIRVLNVGRQRAYCHDLQVQEIKASAFIDIAANLEFRLYIEIYVK